MRRKFYVTIITAFALLHFSNRSFSQSKIALKAQQQIQLLLKEKESRTGAERKISSQLLQAVRESQGKQMAEGVRLSPARVRTDATGNVLVDITGNITDELLGKITSAGGKIISSSGKFHSARASVNFSAVAIIAGYPEVTFIQPAARYHLLDASSGVGIGTSGVNGEGNNNLLSIKLKQQLFKEKVARVQQQVRQYMMILGTGTVNSQGDHAHQADSARLKYGYEGEGIKIGVLSDSYNSKGAAASDVATGNLPGPGNPLGNITPVTVLQDITNGTDEGRAMLQIVHDLAPKSQLFFATADISESGFADNIIALRNAGCDIIIDDVGYFDEPAFEDGIVAQAVNTVTANGALYFSAAGNAGSLLMNTSGVWEGDFTDVGSSYYTIGSKKGTLHNFGTALAPVFGDSIIASGEYYTLNWADPMGGSANDYDLFLCDSSGNIKSSSTDIQNGTQNPYEGFSPPTLVAGDQLIIFKDSAAQVRAFDVNTQRGELKYATDGQTFGHADASAAFSVAATDASAVYPGIFTTSSQVEYFSSDGPRRIFFNADTTPVTPNNFLFATNGGLVRNKPDITGANGVSTTFPSTTGLNPFYGTSAAAPHVGAIAALIKSANPALTATQIRNIITSTAIDIQAPGWDINSGYGIAQALAAVKATNAKGIANITVASATATEGSFSNHDGSIEPGETGNIVVQLLNTSLANATNVSAVISTNTPGITLIKDSVPFGSIASGATSSNTGTPFSFAVAPSVACGTTIQFFVKAYFGGGGESPAGYTFTVTTGLATLLNVTSKLGSAPPTGAGYTATSGQQTGRLSRGTTISSCSDVIPNPGLIATTGQRQYDAYTIKNTTGVDQCVTVTFTSGNGLNLYTAVYDSLGFVPSNPATNFVADPGQSENTMQYSFTAPAGKTFTVTVCDVNVLPASGSTYTLTATYAECEAGPACTPVKITTTSVATGATNVYYHQTFAATGGSGNYVFAFQGNFPAGIKPANDSIYGTPTQAGQFPFVVTATDPIGCPSGKANDTLKITGDVPVSVQAIAGTPQSVIINHAFSSTLSAEVLDAAKKPLGGVNVMFIAPATGASGTFAGGSDTAVIVTDNSGVAVSPTFTANVTQGSYTVQAQVVDVAAAADFQLSNTCPSTIVTNNADAGTGSLRDIVTNACPNATITFVAGISQINLTGGQVTISRSITIQGLGAKNLAISGTGNSRIFEIDTTNPAVTISGLTLTDGVPDASNTNGGGAIVIYSGNIIIDSCVITNNDASQTDYAEGGGIDNEGAAVVINNSSIVNNTAYSDGGGIDIEGGSMTINSCTIANNQIGNDYGVLGGGIFAYYPLAINNSTIYGNKGQYGGNIGYYTNNSGINSVRLKNTIVAGGILTGTGGTGPDLWGDNFVSLNYNLIQNTASGTITGQTSNNIYGVSPNLLPLGNYGGPTPTLLPKPTSVVINAGDPTLTSSEIDQRGYTRVAGGRADIGADETNYKSSISAGTPQSTEVQTQFGSTLQSKITENANPIAGINVWFTAPVTGAGATFANKANIDTAVTNASGIAVTTAVTANDTTGTYNVVDSIGSTIANVDFQLTNTNALPVIFGPITAEVEHCTVQLTWKTETEIESKTFTVEHSTDGIRFTNAYSVPGKGYSNTEQAYTYTDLTPADGMNYYRIVETDVNGNNTYSNVIAVVNNCSNVPIVVYPNPVHNVLNIAVPGADKQTIVAYDASGRIIMRYAAAAGTINIDVTNWAGGIYTIAVIKEGKTIYTVKVVKD